jgi:hypothetical protein
MSGTRDKRLVVRPAQMSAIGLFLLLAISLASLDRKLSTPLTDHQTVHNHNPRFEKGGTVVPTLEPADERLANYTWWVAAFTCTLTLVSAFQIFFLTRADKTARTTAEAAQKSALASIAAQRPWISATAEIESALRITDNEVQIELFVTLLNHGNTPAISTRTVMVMAATNASSSVDLEGAIRRCLEISRHVRREPLQIGVTIFPKQSECARYSLAMQRTEMIDAMRAVEGGTPAILLIAGCVDYTFGAEVARRRSTIFWHRPEGPRLALMLLSASGPQIGYTSCAKSSGSTPYKALPHPRYRSGLLCRFRSSE